MSSPQLVSTDFYKIKKFLGGGSFGAVNLIKIKEDGKFYAMKEIHLKKIQNDEERQLALQEAKNEYKLLRNNLSNVVKSYGSNFDSAKQIFRFTMENLPENLNDYIDNYHNKNKKSLSFKEFLQIFRDILTGNFFFLILYKRAIFFSRSKRITSKDKDYTQRFKA
jgi:serine/threonine protein kinase